MISFNRCIRIVGTTCQSCVHLKNQPFKANYFPTRTFINKWKIVGTKSYFPEERTDELKGFSGLDDPNFTKYVTKSLKEAEFKKAYYSWSTELKRLYDEIMEDYYHTWNFRIDSRVGRVDMLYTFETDEDLKKFSVHTDSSFSQGYSSGSLKLTESGTALFSGNICTDVPKDGNVETAGYAHMSTLLRTKSFFRIKYFDWTDYTHLVFKIRGDGRAYMVVINIYGDFEETQYYSYCHPLYTRGGPYWQVAKMPLSHFYLVSKGTIMTKQNQVQLLRQIKRLGLTAVGLDGPFKLEIDYIGLEYDGTHKGICPYEAYVRK